MTCDLSIVPYPNSRVVRTESHVALKVLAAHTSKVGLDINELDILLNVTSKSATNPGTAHVLGLLDHFEHRGPNGDHLCLVSKPMGPDMSVFRTLFPKAKIPVPTMKRVSKQLLLALSYLHDECQVIHTGWSLIPALFRSFLTCLR